MAYSASVRGRVNQRPRLQNAVGQASHDYNMSDRGATAARGFARSATSRFAQYATRSLSIATPVIFGAVLATILLIGWSTRDEEYLVPDSGAGYWLGIIGASLMMLLLLYPLRKRMPLGLGSVTFWFRLHMVLGLIGPALILFHSNFKLGALNSNVALAAMLIVAGSGIVGRYLYGKIHMGLYGRKVVVRETLADARAMTDSLRDELPGCDRITEAMNAFASAAPLPKNLIASIFSLPLLAFRARSVRSRLRNEARRLIAVEGKRRGWSRRLRAQRFAAIGNLVTLHVAAVKKAAEFGVYDRLFGMWHMLHLPLFIVLILAATLHVIAAHFY